MATTSTQTSDHLATSSFRLPATFPAGARGTVVTRKQSAGVAILGRHTDGRVLCRITFANDSGLTVGDTIAVPDSLIALWSC